MDIQLVVLLNRIIYCKMKKIILLLIFLSIKFNLFAQIDSESVMSIPRATTAELNAITSPTPQIGSIAFDTDKDRLVEYTSTGWTEITTERNVYTGFFIINAPGGTTATSFSQSINSLPFQPSQITFVTHANIESFGINSNNDIGNNTATLANSFGTMNGFARNDSGTISQAVIYIGGSGTSINNISRYSSNNQCLGLRYGDQNAVNLGLISASLTSFDTNGFTLNIDYVLGLSGNINRDNDILDESLIVFYTAYK